MWGSGNEAHLWEGVRVCEAVVGGCEGLGMRLTVVGGCGGLGMRLTVVWLYNFYSR